MIGFWNGRRVFVTGATGLVGSWLVRGLLQDGARVVALVRDSDPQSDLYRSGDLQRIKVVSGALEDFWTVERAINEHEIDTVFHLGAQTIVGTAHRFPLSTFEANIRGTYHVLEAARLHPQLVRQIVIASSDKAYGDQPELPYREEMQLNGRHPYDVSKSCADLIAQAYHHSYDLPVAVARCGNVFGGGDLNWSRIVPGTIRSLLNGERPVIRSNGNYVRDYIYVEDVAAAYMRVAECLAHSGAKGHAFNFSNERPQTVLELVNTMRRLMGCESIDPTILNCAEGEIQDQALCAAKARTTLGWAPQFGLEEGLTKTIGWYRAFLG